MGTVVELRPPAYERPLIRNVQGLTVIQGADTAERFDGLNHAVDAKASKFWRFDTGTDLIPYPDSDEYRLDQLNAVFVRIEGLDDAERNWRKKKSPKKVGEAMLQGIKVKQGNQLLEVPAIELFDHAAVNYWLMRTLAENGDPGLAVVKKFESWRVRNTLEQEDHPIVKEDDLERGYRAFELFLFGAGGSGFRNILKQIAEVHYD